jgi:hypothetical protein
MNELMAGLGVLMAQEMERAGKLHGQAFHSSHEAYGVIAEELMEARSEMSCLQGAEAALLRVIHRDDALLYHGSVDEMGKTALRAAAELIQVAAMCHKAKLSLQGGEKEPTKRENLRKACMLGEWGVE